MFRCNSCPLLEYPLKMKRADIHSLGYGFQPRLLLSVIPYEADGFGYTGIVYFVLRFFHLYGIYRTPSNSNNNRLASNPPP